MKSFPRPVLVAAAIGSLCVTTAFHAPTARADSSSHKAEQFVSGTGNILYLAAGVGLPLLEDGTKGKNHALRAADALGTSVLITELAKNIFHERRPDGSDHESFPSGHATAAFAVATMESSFHPKQAPLWYLGAALISASRVTLHRHYIQDVVVGALVGYGTAKWELGQPRGLILSPIIGSSRGGSGVQLTMQF